MPLTHLQAPRGTVKKMNLSAGDCALGDTLSCDQTECYSVSNQSSIITQLVLLMWAAEEGWQYWSNESAIYILTNPLTSDYKSTPLLRPACSQCIKCTGVQFVCLLCMQRYLTMLIPAEGSASPISLHVTVSYMPPLYLRCKINAFFLNSYLPNISQCYLFEFAM